MGNIEEVKTGDILIVKNLGGNYFVGVKEREGKGLLYEWRLNNQVINAGKNVSSLSFKQEGESTGTASVSLQVSNPAKIFQFANNNIAITFGKNNSGFNLFPTQ